MRILLYHVRGSKSFEDFKTVNGIVYRTYQEAAVALNLIEDDHEFIVCMEEGCNVMPPNQIRKDFAYFLCYNSVHNSKGIWESFKDRMCEDYFFRSNNANSSENKALMDIEQVINISGYTLQTFNLPEITEIEDVIEEEYNAEEELEYYNTHIDTLNEDQRHVFNEITVIISDDEIKNKCFFIDGP